MNIRKTTCILAISLMTLGSMTTTVWAEEKSSYQPVQGNSVLFDSTLYLQDNTAVPALAFTYKVEPWTAGTVNGIFNGNQAGKVKGTPVIYEADGTNNNQNTAELHFSSDDQLTPEKITKNETSFNAVRKKMKLDFSTVTFSQPGIYRYLVQESQNNPGITREDDDGIHAVDVYVTADENNLRIAGAFMHMDQDGTPASSQSALKTQEFVNRYVSSSLTVEKKIEGNQASKDEYFRFDVKITGGKDGEKLNISLPDISDSGKTNPSYLQFTGNEAEETFWLKANERAVIYGLHDAMGYTVREDKTAMDSEGYSVTASIAGDDKKRDGTVIQLDQDYAVSDEEVKADTTITYTNTKNGIVPTGIMMSTVPGACVCAFSAIGLIGLMRRKKDSEDQ